MKEEKEEVRRNLSSYTKERSNLVSILQKVQEKVGYLSLEAMLEISRFLWIPESKVWGVATFYNQFRLTPLGKRHIKACMGTACHLQGGERVLGALERELKIEVGGVTEDRKFSLERVCCIGCCMMAPVVVISDTIYPRMTPFKVEEALVGLKNDL